MKRKSKWALELLNKKNYNISPRKKKHFKLRNNKKLTAYFEFLRTTNNSSTLTVA